MSRLFLKNSAFSASTYLNQTFPLRFFQSNHIVTRYTSTEDPNLDELNLQLSNASNNSTITAILNQINKENYSISTYNALLKFYTKNDTHKFIEVYRELQETSLNYDSFTFHILLNHFAKKYAVFDELSDKLLSQEKTSGKISKNYDKVLKILLDRKAYKKFDKFLKKLPESYVNLEGVSIVSILLKYYNETKKNIELDNLIKRIQISGLDNNPLIRQILIKIYLVNEKNKEAEEILKKMKLNNQNLNHTTVSKLLEYYLKIDDKKNFEELVNNEIIKGSNFSSLSLSLMVKYYTKNGDFNSKIQIMNLVNTKLNQKSKEVFKNFEFKKNNNNSNSNFEILKKINKSKSKFDFENLKNEIIENNVSYSIISEKFLQKSSKFKSCNQITLDLINHILNLNYNLNINTYLIILNFFANQKKQNQKKNFDFDKIYNLFLKKKNFENLNENQNKKLLNILFILKDSEKIEYFYQNKKKNLNFQEYNSLAVHFAKNFQIKLFQEIFLELKNNKFIPGSNIYLKIISKFSINKYYHTLDIIVNDMKKKNIPFFRKTNFWLKSSGYISPLIQFNFPKSLKYFGISFGILIGAIYSNGIIA